MPLNIRDVEIHLFFVASISNPGGMKKFLRLALLLTPLGGFSQKLENLQAVPQGEKIIITYDISADFAGDKFDISLYASSNNFSSPLQQVQERRLTHTGLANDIHVASAVIIANTKLDPP